MNVTVKELRMQPGRIISMANAGNEITVTMRGRPAAKIVPIRPSPERQGEDAMIAFGIWQDRSDMDDVGDFVCSLRKGRML